MLKLPCQNLPTVALRQVGQWDGSGDLVSAVDGGGLNVQEADEGGLVFEAGLVEVGPTRRVPCRAVSEGRSVPDSWIAASSILAGVHTAAQGYPYPFWPPPSQPILEDAVAELGRQLTRALYTPQWVKIACATLIGHPVLQPLLVATLHGGRLLITRTPHTSKLPHTDRRFDRHLLVDLRLLTWEGHRGVTRLCPQCSRPHQLRTTWLEGISTHQVHSQPADKTPSPGVYPDVEDAAFAEILGPLDNGLDAFDQLLIGLPPGREAHCRKLWAEHPQVLTYLELISTR